MSLLIQSLVCAFAMHIHLVRSEPAANDTVTAAPAAIKFWFSERPELAITSVKLKTSAGTMVPLAPLVVDTGANGALVAGVPGTLPKGEYLVTWRTTAMDGHPASGHFDFVVSH